MQPALVLLIWARWSQARYCCFNSRNFSCSNYSFLLFSLSVDDWRRFIHFRRQQRTLTRTSPYSCVLLNRSMTRSPVTICPFHLSIILPAQQKKNTYEWICCESTSIIVNSINALLLNCFCRSVFISTHFPSSDSSRVVEAHLRLVQWAQFSSYSIPILP